MCILKMIMWILKNTNTKDLQLDEWRNLGEGDSESCVRYVREHVVGPLKVAPERFLSFDGLAPDGEAECARVAAVLQSWGGVGFSVLGLGANGHLGFNEPGDDDDAGVDAALARTAFVASLSLESQAHSMVAGRDAPTEGLTLGLADLCAAPRSVVMVTGAHKASVLRAALRMRVSAQRPASVLRRFGRSVLFVCDEAAAALPPDPHVECKDRGAAGGGAGEGGEGKDDAPAAAAGSSRPVKTLPRPAYEGDPQALIKLCVPSGSDDVEKVRDLIARGINIDEQDGEQCTALMHAALQNRIEIVKELVRAGAALDVQDKDVKTALIYGTLVNRIEIVKELIRAGAALDVQDVDGKTALMFAAGLNRIEIAKELVRAGAALNVKDEDGTTALQFAQESENDDIVALLEEAEAAAC